jgi:mannose-6-phosphate isomerase-like protein (cupin superfamily)
MTTLRKVTLADNFAEFSDYWNPRIIGELNGQHVKAVKLKGEFLWHQHEHEMFLVVKGTLTMRLRDGNVTVGPGEFLIVQVDSSISPARQEVESVLFEPASTLNNAKDNVAQTISNGLYRRRRIHDPLDDLHRLRPRALLVASRCSQSRFDHRAFCHSTLR